MSNPTELPDLAEAVRKLVKAKGRFHTEQNYKELADALAQHDARRAQPKDEAPQAVALSSRITGAHACFSEAMPPGSLTSIGHAHVYQALQAAISHYAAPLCGAQHAESGKEVDGLPIEELWEIHGALRAAGKVDLSHKIVLEVRRRQGAAGRAALAALQAAAPGTPEAPKKPAHGHRDDYYLLANGRRLGLEPISRVRNMPNWVLAMELFATGSTSARQLCRDAGVHPDSTITHRAAAPKGGV